MLDALRASGYELHASVVDAVAVERMTKSAKRFASGTQQALLAVRPGASEYQC